MRLARLLPFVILLAGCESPMSIGSDDADLPDPDLDGAIAPDERPDASLDPSVDGSRDGATVTSDGASETRVSDGALETEASAADGGLACTPGTLEERACGRCGKQLRVCGSDGSWSDPSVCNGETGACVPGESGSEPCGASGTRTRTCSVGCTWGAFGACVEPPECAPGETQSESCGRCGTRTRSCTGGRWSPFGSCGSEGECTPGSIDETSCPTGGKKRRTCGTDCRYGDFGACPVVTGCSAGAVDRIRCGNCGERIRVCSTTGTWSEPSACTREGVCAAGTKEERACGLGGKESRTCTSACAWNDWGVCEGTAARPLWVLAIDTSNKSESASAPVSILRIGSDGTTTAPPIAMPVAKNGNHQPFTLDWNFTGRGALDRSPDGRFVAAAGFGIPPGFEQPGYAPSSVVPRVLARIDASGNVDTTTTTGASLDRRSVASVVHDGIGFWTHDSSAGSTGLIYVPFGGASATAIESDVTFVTHAAGALFVARDLPRERELIVSRANGFPRSAAASIKLFTGFYSGRITGIVPLAVQGGEIDTIYVAYASAANGTLHRFTKSGATWTGTPVTADLKDYEWIRHITGEIVAGDVHLYATYEQPYSQTIYSRVVALIDKGGRAAAITGKTILQTTSTAQKKRLEGIAFAPR
jgi:hypothetical protein